MRKTTMDRKLTKLTGNANCYKNRHNNKEQSDHKTKKRGPNKETRDRPEPKVTIKIPRTQNGDLFKLIIK